MTRHPYPHFLLDTAQHSHPTSKKTGGRGLTARRILLPLLLILLCGCSPKRADFEPKVVYVPSERDFTRIPSAFPPLSEEELEEPWGSELYAGRCFAKELDLYRAITSFKKARFLIHPGKLERVYEIEFCIVESYFLAGRYVDVVNQFEMGRLKEANPETLPPFRDLLLILWESYRKIGECEKAERILELIEKQECELKRNLEIYLNLSFGNLPAARMLAQGTPQEAGINGLHSCFCASVKSVKRAEILNACLPGAGYWYVGEKKAAVTSFLINALFGFAAYRFFDKGYTAAGLITLSLETGWYFGGINGAALEAKYHNERIYQQNAECVMTDLRLFPALMLDWNF